MRLRGKSSRGRWWSLEECGPAGRVRSPWHITGVGTGHCSGAGPALHSVDVVGAGARVGGLPIQNGPLGEGQPAGSTVPVLLTTSPRPFGERRLERVARKGSGTPVESEHLRGSGRRCAEVPEGAHLPMGYVIPSDTAYPPAPAV